MTELSKRARRTGIVAILGVAAIWLAVFADLSRGARESVFLVAMLAVVISGAVKDKADS
jgi:hypothetical protein